MKPDQSPSDIHQVHARISGHVQGVGFRYYVYHFAQIKDLTGWVRNLHNGQVELFAEGPMEDLSTLLSLVREGPSGAMVSDIDMDWPGSQKKYDRFSMLPTD
ncbi:MAG: acylphosphatase [Chloroflexi bacterium]|nr:acylphosphatase [Chloroflexota bacterium]